MNREKIQELMNQILARQGRPPATSEELELRAIGFRSLDFSELALRVERAAGRELNFDAGKMRAITTVRDVLDFFDRALSDA